MKPLRHAVVSFVAGSVIWLVTKNLLASLICFCAGVMPDIDHVVDFVVYHGMKNLSYVNICRAFTPDSKDNNPYYLPKLYLFFHSVELAVIIWLVLMYTNNMYVMAIAAGYSIHLIMDNRGNKMSAWFYFILWRMAHNFNTDYSKGPVLAAGQKNKDDKPSGG